MAYLFEVSFHLEAFLFQKLSRLLLSGKAALRITYIVREEREIPLRRDRGIEVAYCARRAVPRVFEGFGCGLVVARKVAEAKYALALDLYSPLIRYLFWEFSYRAHLFGDDLSRDAVSSRRCLDELPAIVQQVEREAVEFVFAGELGHIPDRLDDARRPIVKLAFALAFVKAVKPP